MLTKTQPDEIQDYLADASYVKGGHASRVVFPESAADVAEILAKATSDRTPVTVSGAGTALAWWATGRGTGDGLTSDDGRVPRIEAW